MTGFTIRAFEDADWPQVWAILQAIFAAGDTYPYPGDIPQSEARAIWIESPRAAFVACDEGDGRILGTYYIRANAPGLGDHICNCGYATAAAARGRGIATAMCEHSQRVALELGFHAMQFNKVVATNTGAVRLWQSLGFEIIGTVPHAFRHASLGFTDAHIMYKKLT